MDQKASRAEAACFAADVEPSSVGMVLGSVGKGVAVLVGTAVGTEAAVAVGSEVHVVKMGCVVGQAAAVVEEEVWSI